MLRKEKTLLNWELGSQRAGIQRRHLTSTCLAHLVATVVDNISRLKSTHNQLKELSKKDCKQLGLCIYVAHKSYYATEMWADFNELDWV